MAQAPLLAKCAIDDEDHQTEWVFSANGLSVVRIAGKGLGVVTTRAFRAGECIIAEQPIAVIAVSEATPSSVFDRTVRGLEPSAQKDFWRLMQTARFGSVKTARGIWLSNAYPLEPKPGARRAALYPFTSRVNHSCQPNVHLAIREGDGVTLHAVRAIGIGEEVSNSYLDVGKTRQERRATMASKFGFECRCTLCALCGSALTDSDRRQSRLAVIDRTLEAVGNEHARLEGLVEERAKVLAEEGLPSEWAWNEMLRVFTHYCMREDYVTARRWMRRTIGAAKLILGGDSPTVEKLRAIIKEG